jgi:hypothetical protein
MSDLTVHILNGLRLALIGLEDLEELLVNVGLSGEAVLSAIVSICLLTYLFQERAAYLDLIHITYRVVELDRSTLLHAVAIDHDILTGKWRSSARCW